MGSVNLIIPTAHASLCRRKRQSSDRGLIKAMKWTVMTDWDKIWALKPLLTWRRSRYQIWGISFHRVLDVWSCSEIRAALNRGYKSPIFWLNLQQLFNAYFFNVVSRRIPKLYSLNQPFSISRAYLADWFYHICNPIVTIKKVLGRSQEGLQGYSPTCRINNA